MGETIGESATSAGILERYEEVKTAIYPEQKLIYIAASRSVGTELY
jgi:hypothetical protein